MHFGREMKKTIKLMVLSILIIAAAGCSSKLSSNQENGYEVFKNYCSSCHKINGQGGEVGPDLSKIGSYKEKSWLQRWIKNPKAVKPETRMPVVGLTEDQINDVSDYLTTLK